MAGETGENSREEMQEGQACFCPSSSLEWKEREREINNSLGLFSGYWSTLSAKSTSHKGNCLTLRQGTMWKEQDKIKLQVTA